MTMKELYQTNDQQGTTTPLSFTIESFKLYQTNNKQGTTISYQLFIYARRGIYNRIYLSVTRRTDCCTCVFSHVQQPLSSIIQQNPFQCLTQLHPQGIGAQGIPGGIPCFPVADFFSEAVVGVLVQIGTDP